MRIFVVVCCLAYASGQGYNYQFPAPQTNYLPPSDGSQGSPGPQGYSYQFPVAGTGPGSAPGSGAPYGSFQAGGAPSAGASYGGSYGSAPATGKQGPAQVEGFLSGSVQSTGAQVGVSSGAQGGFSGASFTGGNVRTEYVKEFFNYHVDDKEYISVNQGNQNAGTVKKNIRVVIIKGPEVSGLEEAAVAVSKNVNEQKLAIYVLSKQADIEALTNKLSTSDIQINHKPEVHFVKYKTEDDAEKAKEAIHKQYESLDGPSSSQDGGAVPVHTFASKSAAPDSAPVSAPAPAAPTQAAPAQPAVGYLPSSVV